MKTKERHAGGLSALAPSLLTGLVLTFILMAVFAAVVYHLAWATDTIAPLTFFCMALGACLTAWLTARHCATHRFVQGMLGAVALYACLLLLSLSWFGMPIEMTRLATGAVVTLMSGAVGAVLGSQRKKRRKKHR